MESTSVNQGADMMKVGRGYFACSIALGQEPDLATVSRVPALLPLIEAEAGFGFELRDAAQAG